MADYQAIIHGVRSYLRSGATAHNDEVADLAAGYASLCRETNLRLRRCAEYVRLGCFAEASHLARCQPPLDRLAPALQLPELHEWNQLCGRLGLQQAPALLADDLAGLKTAIAAERKLSPLLARHRTLAIARASTRERLRVVRLLIKHDSENPSWPEEGRRLEGMRLSEIQLEGDRLLQCQEPAELRDLLDELDEPWLMEIPFEIQELVRPLKEKQQLQAAEKELAAIAKDLIGRDALAIPADVVTAAEARWKRLPPAIIAQLDDQQTVIHISNALARCHEAEQSRREQEQAKQLNAIFKPAEAEPETKPPRRFRWKPLLVVFVILACATAAVYAYLQANPDALARIRDFLFPRH